MASLPVLPVPHVPDAVSMPIAGAELPFREMAELIGEQLAYFDCATSTCRFANKSYARLCGHTPTSIVGLHARVLLDAASWSYVQPFLEQACRGHTVSYQRDIGATDAIQRKFNVTLTPHIDDSGVQRGVLAIARDVTAYWQAERAMHESEARFRKFAEATEEAIVFHANGTILDFNEAMTRLVGHTLAEARGKDLFDYLAPASRDAARAYARRGDEFLYEVALLHRDGHEVPVEVIGKTMPRDGNNYRVVVARDIRTRKHMQEREAFLALHDALTELPNRRSLFEHLETTLTHARESQTSCAVFSVNLDHFKTVNDSLGHSIGDKLLCQTAERLSACVGTDGFAARPEGDAFVLVVPSLTRDTADALARKVLQEVARPTQVAGTRLALSVSVGVAMFPEDGSNASGLVRQAEAAQRMAKQSGRGNHQFSVPGTFRLPIEELRLEHELREALHKGDLVLHYQPVMQLADGCVAGVEALVRWQHPTRGLLPPSAFIEFAESHGLIAAIGHWVLGEACRQLKRWQASGMTQLTMAVNVSAMEFRQRDVAHEIALVLKETGIDARSLEIELTEGVLMHHSESLLATLRAIKALGVRIAIDDFGTGYSSLSYLKRYPLDKLKIDRSFVTDTPGDADDVAIVTAVVQLGRSLDLLTVAEGVENDEQHALLVQLGCDLAQGYALARPMPAGAATAWLQERVITT